MKNLLLKIVISIILIFFDFGQSLQAMEPDATSNERELYLSDQINSKSIELYESQHIIKLNEDNFEKIELLTHPLEENCTIKSILIRISGYLHNTIDFYKNDSIRSEFLTNYNINSYDSNDSNKPHININGFLSIPHGDGPFPCVVLCHGSDGDTFMSEYMNTLANEGMATISLSRFGHYYFQGKQGNRQCVMNTSENQLLVPLEAEIIETLSAAKLMASHPKIDPKKIGFMGWSRGGNVALECSLKRNIDAIYPSFQPAFCINYYTMPLIQRKDTLETPILFLHGSNDDYTPVSRLLAYVNFLTAKNYTVPKNFDDKEVIFDSGSLRIVIYPNSGHAFDVKSPSWRNLFNMSQGFIEKFSEIARFKWNEIWEGSFQQNFPKFMNMSDCCVRSLENDKGFVGADGEERQWAEFPEYLRNKIRYGVTLEVNPKAGMNAWQEALAFIKKCTVTTLI